MKTRISKWGNSLAVRIPKAFSAEARLEEGTEVDITVAGGRIVLTPVVREYALDDLVAGITSENRHSETGWGNPVGNEVG